MGLIKYVMSLMNGARIGVALQALGIAQAAYDEAIKYAHEREQFGKKIIQFTAVYEMLTNMKVDIEASRSLIYATSMIVDMRELLEEQTKDPGEATPEEAKQLRERMKHYDKLASVLTPISKYVAAEMSIRVTSDAIQIHGGTGYMKEFNVERHYRDARITSIYEGTSQFQVIASIGGILTGTLTSEIERIRSEEYSDALNQLLSLVDEGMKIFKETIKYVKELKDKTYNDLIARRIVDMGADLYIAHLLLQHARISGRKKEVAEVFIQRVIPHITANAQYILSDNRSIIDYHRDILGLDMPK